MATFAHVIATTAPSSPQLYVRVLTGTVASPTTSVARAAMTAQVTVGSTSAWEYYVSAWDATWANPRILYDDGARCWYDDSGAPTNVAQIAGREAVSENGNGADACTMNITSDGSPLADADVWITSTDDPSASVVAGVRQTDSDGNVTFYLNAGVQYYLWAQKDGVNTIEGEAFTAVAD